MKKAISLLVSGIFVVSIASMPASAVSTPVMAEPEISVLQDVCESASVASNPAPGVEAEIDVGMGSGIEVFSSYQIVYDPISAGGSEWTQPIGYCSYRVWVDNTSNETMKVTVTSDGGTFVMEVAPNSSKIILTVNNAAEGYVHKIDFKTQSGVGSGSVAVRVSDVAF